MLVIIVGVIITVLALVGTAKYLHPKSSSDRTQLTICVALVIVGILIVGYGASLPQF